MLSVASRSVFVPAVELLKGFRRHKSLLMTEITHTRFYYNSSVCRSSSPKFKTFHELQTPERSAFQFFWPGVYASEHPINCVCALVLMYQII